MGAILKGLQSVLIALGIIAVVGTGIIIYYNAVKPQDEEVAVAEQTDTGTDTGTDDTYTETETETETESETEGTESTENTDSYITGDTPSSVFSAENGHEHTYTSTVLKPATCTETGEVRYTCYCGDFYVDAIPALDHTPGNWVTVRTATNSQTGLRQRSCTTCGRVLEEETIPMLTPATPVNTSTSNTGSNTNTNTGSNTNTNTNANSTDNHKHSYTYEITKEASCTEKGEKTYTCATCGSTFKTSIPATNHPSRKTVRTEGNCANPGKIETICNLCNAVISSETLYYDHNWSSWTTDSSGNQTRTCKNCNETQTKNKSGSSSNNNNNNNNGSSGNTGNNGGNSGNNGGNSGNNGGNSGTTPHTHTYTSAITTQPTCESPGVTTYTCTAGDNSYTENAPEALGHRWGSWVTTKPATTEEEGVMTKTCTRCQKQETQAIAKLPEVHVHSFDNGTIVRKPTCIKEGSRKRTCTSCGFITYTTIPLASHNYQWVTDPGDSTQELHKCSVCGEVDNTRKKDVTPTP